MCGVAQREDLMVTIIIGVLVFAAVAAIIRRGIRNRKHHKGGCSCGCSGCPGSSLCHPEGAVSGGKK